MDAPLILLVDPAHFSVDYVINPWMSPRDWARDPAGHQRAARAGFEALRSGLEDAGAVVDVLPGALGLPDMVFPANGAVVLDRRAMVARFRHPERRGEERVFFEVLQDYVDRGLLDEVVMFPEGVFQEGAGDCIWDDTRDFFWAAHGQRSAAGAAREVESFFAAPVVALELATEHFYHLDTCFCPLAGGEVLYYPPAFTDDSLATIHAHVEPAKRLEADGQDAAAFCVNAVNIGRSVVMARAPQHARAMLTERGYAVMEVDLAPFIMSGGGAYCMTLRLDRQRREGRENRGR